MKKVTIIVILLLLLSVSSGSEFGHREYITGEMQFDRVVCFCADWLENKYADRNNDGKVDFRDYAEMLKVKAVEGE